MLLSFVINYKTNYRLKNPSIDIVRCHGGFKSTVIDGELHILGVGDLSYVYGAFENELVPWMEACLGNIAVCNTPKN